MSKENLNIPLRVRVTEAEDRYLMRAAERLRLTRSTYVRWALKNSSLQILNEEMDGTPVVHAKPQKVKRPKPEQPAPVPVVEEPYVEPVIENVYVPEPMPVPDLLTAMGLAAPGDPEPALFDDSDWE